MEKERRYSLESIGVQDQDLVAFGRFLRDTRKSQGRTLKDVSGAVGISPTYLVAIEKS